MSQKRQQPRRPKAAEVTNFDSDSDDDFNTVAVGARGKQVSLAAATAEPEVNPNFPASDPSKVIVIGKGEKKPEPAAAQKEEKVVEEVKKPVAAAPAKAKSNKKSAA